MARKRQPPPLHNAHDHSYKLLFSHPEMVADLLRGYTHPYPRYATWFPPCSAWKQSQP